MNCQETATTICPSQAKNPAFIDACTGRVFQPPCNKWSCPVCRRKKAKAFYAAALREFHGCRVRMLTLTHRQDPNLTIEQHWQLHRTAWRVFVQLLWKYERRRGAWRKPRYLRVLERHRSGIPHAHVLFDAFFHRQPAQRLWNTACRRAYRKLGFAEPAQKLGNAKLTGTRGSQSLLDGVRYAVKYLTKGQLTERELSREERKTRLFSSSRKLKLRRGCPIIEQTRYRGLWVRLPREARAIAHLFLQYERIMIPDPCHYADGDLRNGWNIADGLLDCEPEPGKLWYEYGEKTVYSKNTVEK